MNAATSIDELRRRLQRAQQTDVTYRLSEQNCVEVVRRLTEARLLTVLYTMDGKEYVTPQQLDREVLRELQASGGRVELIELQRALNMDLAFVEDAVQRLLRAQKGLTLLAGELFSDDFFAAAAEEIDELLQDAGQLHVGDLCQRFNLPIEFVHQMVEARLGKTIHGQRDAASGTLYTAAYLRRQRATIRGALTATTRFTPLRTLCQQHAVPERIVSGIVEDLLSSGAVAGKLRGARDNAAFVPEVFQRLQADAVAGFFRQNGYIEADALRKLEVDDARAFMRRMFPDAHVALPHCFVAPSVVDQADAALDEALATAGWVAVVPLVPSPLTDDDIDALLGLCPSLHGRLVTTEGGAGKLGDDAVVQLAGHHLFTGMFLQTCCAALEPLVKEAARKAATAPSAPSDAAAAPTAADGKKPRTAGADVGDEDDWSTDGQARGRKGKKGGRSAAPASASAAASSRSGGRQGDKLPSAQLKATLQQTQMAEAEDDVLDDVLVRLRPRLVQVYDEQAEQMKAPSVFSGASRKKAQEATRDQVDDVRQNMLLFQRGLQLFEDAQTSTLLERHLVKTLGASIVDVLAVDLARMHNLVPVDGEGADGKQDETAQQVLAKRDDFIARFPAGDSKAMRALATAQATAKTSDEFLAALDAAAPQLGLHWKKTDKKRERQVVFKQRQALLTQLRAATEPSLVLHLVSLLLFQQVTKCMLSAPGKLVPQILGYLGLSKALPADQMDVLTKAQALVIKSIGAGKGDPAVMEQLQQQTELVRALALAAGGADTSDVPATADE